MSRYYFLAPLLPDLQLGVPPQINDAELNSLMEINLSEKDKLSIKKFKTFYDLQNIRNLWRNEELSFRGNFNKHELLEYLATLSELPEFVFDFLSDRDNTKQRLEHYSFLLSKYFSETIPQTTGFLHDYLLFEQSIRHILTGLRAKKLKRNLLEELEYEDPSSPIVAHLISQKDAEEYEPPEEYKDLKELYHAFHEDPLKLQQALSEYKIKKIDELTKMDLFSIDTIVAYLAKLTIIEQNLELNKEKGLHIVEKILKESV